MKCLLTVFSFAYFFFSTSYSQINPEWTSLFNGSGNGPDYSNAMAIDNSGNIYVTGESNTSAGSNDLIIIKYNPDGDTLWVRYYNGAANSRDVGRAITFDSSGNVYVTGESRETTVTDIITIKYSSNGVRQWASIYNGQANGPDGGTAIVVDNNGNVFVTGYSDGDPSTVFRQDDCVTIKYNSAGTELWVRRYNGTSNTNDVAHDIAVDVSGNVYVAGETSSSGAGYDYVTLKYNSDGTLLWDELYNGPAGIHDFAYAVAVDANGNVYVTGSSDGSSADDEDYATIKYNSGGTQQWISRYNGMGGGDEARNLFLKGSDLYVTGYSRNPASPFSYDFLTIKYDAVSGDTVWTARYNGNDDKDDFGLSVFTDNSDNVIVTGYGNTNTNGFDITTVKYNSFGAEQWNISYNGTGNGSDVANTVLADTSGNVYITGTTSSSGSANDIITIKYVEGATGIINAFVKSPDEYSLSQNYPNPFNPATTINWSSPSAGWQIIKIFNSLGQVVETIVDEFLEAGNHSKMYIAKSTLPSGMYFYKLTSGNYSETKKMILIK